MPDREKVVALLERYVRIPNLAGAENYGAKIVDMPAPLITDALALLKAQELVEPTIGGDADGPCRTWWYQCGKCKEAIDYHDKYCRNCGQAVKWDG